ncbi:insulinase family protein [Selenomonas sp. oral taxon 478]|uniref:insulinase family protein n=1 Tax=Selenomonas sp. oral taxon 478 TaxID=712538 RepID=UPI00067A2748|nr:insulinase family protein [Selenomonas sp. oral taxon 478]AKT54291.1 peptidase M16 [Selenomonas sp. oral taxon 478]
MKIDDVIHGFRLLRSEQITEAEGTARTFVHEKTGAQLFFLETADDNKVFSISFRTPPVDDTGVAHIVEHSVLCGSRKYPLKEPFVELVKGSLNTFLNAMTFPDKTMYPVASRNDRDFQNLMDVYLDAVFYPAMRENPQVLMQEGWHYELENTDAPLTYSGVVYNEMKGALSAPDDLLGSRIMAALYPDTTYGYESGGDPEAIPALTQEQFLAFHARYYHPSNSYIYLYGNLDIEEKLAYLDRAYLSHFDRIPVPSRIDRQSAFPACVRKNHFYPIGAEEPLAENAFLSLSWVIGDTSDMKRVMALQILDHALLRMQGAPLRQALIDAGLGRDVDSNYESDILQPFFSIVVSKSETARAEEFARVVRETLTQLADGGLNHQLVQASLNTLEFRLRESDFGSSPKGLIYGIRLMKTWLYGGAPEDYLRYEDTLAALKKGLKDGYFEQLIREAFLDNPHAALVTLAPSRTLGAERAAVQAAELAEKKAAMSADEVAEVMRSCAALKAAQEAPDTEEALRSIPILARSDIRKDAERLPLEVRDLAGTKMLFSDLETNGIVYLNFYFPMAAVAQEDLPYAYLLAEMFGAVDTAAHSYAELAMLRSLYTGGIGADIVAYTRAGEADSLMPRFKLRAKVLRENLPRLFELLTEIIGTSDFSGSKRIRELVDEEKTGMELSLQRAANQVVASRIAAYLTPAGAYAEVGGLPFHDFLSAFKENFDADHAKMQAAFARILPQIFNRNDLILSVTAPASMYDETAEQLAAFRDTLSAAVFPPALYTWNICARNEGLTTQSRVQYVAKGANFLKLGYRYTGTMRVLETLLRYDYFWTRIRVQGGAYGAMTQFNRNGFMVFSSYRDPNLAETLDVLDETADYVRTFDVSDREMDKFIIGTMSGVDAPMTPQMKGDIAATFHLRGITQGDRQRARDEILTAQQADIRALAPLVADAMQANVRCVLGGEEKIRENAALFDAVRPALRM